MKMKEKERSHEMKEMEGVGKAAARTARIQVRMRRGWGQWLGSERRKELGSQV